MAKETAAEQKRNPDGTFAPKGESGGDDGKRQEAVKPGNAGDKERFEESLEREGLSPTEGADRLTELMEAAEDVGVEVEGADPEALEAAQERLEEDGSIEAAVDALTEGIKADEATEAEGEQPPESIPFEQLSEELGVSADDVMVTAKVQGEEQELPLSEALQGYQREATFTKKTMELAEQRREVEQKGEEYAQGLEMLAVTLGENLSPQEQQALISEYQRVVGQVAEASRPDPETVEQEREQLRESFGWDDPETWDEARTNLRSYATEDLGFSEEALANVHDHRLMTILEKARRYDALQGEASELSEKAAKRRSSGRTLKPGARSGKAKKSQSSEALERLQRTGSVDDAADALAGILDEGGEI